MVVVVESRLESANLKRLNSQRIPRGLNTDRVPTTAGAGSVQWWKLPIWRTIYGGPSSSPLLAAIAVKSKQVSRFGENISNANNASLNRRLKSESNGERCAAF